MTKFTQLQKTLKTTQQAWLVTGNAGFIGSNLTEFILFHKHSK